MKMKMKNYGLLFILLLSNSLHAANALKDELNQVLNSGKAFPDKATYPKTDALSYESAIENLRSKYDLIARVGTTSSYLGFPVSVAQLVSAQANLAQALLKDWHDVAHSGVKYRLPTYIDTSGKTLEAHRNLRMEMAHDLNTISLLRSSLARIHKTFSTATTFYWNNSGLSQKVTEAGLLSLSEGSPASQELLARMSSGFLQDYIELENNYFNLAQEASRAESVSKGEELQTRLATLRKQKHLMNTLLDIFEQFSSSSLRASQEFRDRSRNGFVDVNEDARKLGEGFKRTMEAARKFVESGGLTNHSPGIEVAREGAEFAIPPEKVSWMLRRMAGYSEHGGGGRVLGNLNLHEDEMPNLLKHFERLLLEHYVIVEAASSGRLKQRKKLFARAKKALGYGAAKQNANIPLLHSETSAGNADAPPQETLSEELKLWHTFIEASGLKHAKNTMLPDQANGCPAVLKIFAAIDRI